MHSLKEYFQGKIMGDTGDTDGTADTDDTADNDDTDNTADTDDIDDTERRILKYLTL